MIYLDNAATTYPKPDKVYEKMMDVMKNYGANPGRAGHKLALAASREIYECRDNLCKLFNIKNPMNIIFTYNATDSLNLSIKGFLKSGDHVVTTSMEHNSVIRPIKTLENIGVENTIVQCNENGELNIDDIKKSIRCNTKLVVTTHASNVCGTLIDIKSIGQICRENNVAYLVDASQTAGVYNIDVDEMNIDMLAIPGHKCLLGPQGTGILYVNDKIKLMQLKEGGTGSKSELLTQPDILPDKYESGTPNTPGIAGLNEGVKFILDKGVENIRKKEEELTDYFIKELMQINDIKIYGVKNASNQASVISINIDNEDSSEISYILDEDFGIATRSGLHCAPLAHKTLNTFEQGSVRFSIGYFNTKQEIDTAIDALKTIVKNIKK